MALQKPGEKPNKNGEYKEVGPRGGQISNARQVTITPDDGHLPPTQKSGRKWDKI
ncbi:hypothetical protein MMKA1_08340 [Methanococcus maripaludis KA1]|jgi:hypothetical protein|uniref:YjzC-like protein n=1 Tax=Methanococcus maripaludis KA1 TaxID=637914 RepID=A0A2Z5PTH7_METMI|nr:YjzC family protein [Methanococcus maripaludis]BAP60951.1 hypothetical protein MMKA1_08340 [Methanococcus maripaludis KA1]